jgi:hypothetical protein
VEPSSSPAQPAAARLPAVFDPSIRRPAEAGVPQLCARFRPARRRTTFNQTERG